jgi:hypothetical protein
MPEAAISCSSFRENVAADLSARGGERDEEPYFEVEVDAPKAVIVRSGPGSRSTAGSARRIDMTSVSSGRGPFR